MSRFASLNKHLSVFNGSVNSTKYLLTELLPTNTHRTWGQLAEPVTADGPGLLLSVVLLGESRNYFTVGVGLDKLVSSQFRILLRR